MPRLLRLVLIALLLSTAAAPGALEARSLCKACQQEGSGR
jgi:hypothetical protein